MAYNELTTSLYSKRGDGSGINSNSDRAEIYGHSKPFERPGKISDNWYLHTSSEHHRYYVEVTRKAADQLRQKTRKDNREKNPEIIYCAESIDTWEVTKYVTLKGLSLLVGVAPSSATRSLSEKIIVSRFFFYKEGERPSEDDIDAMLDFFEFKQKRRIDNILSGRWKK